MSQFPEESLELSSGEGFGYFPAYPGLKLNKDRYKIVRKLGYGPRSSVWLVVDSANDEYLAIKILTAHETLLKPSLELDALKIAGQKEYINLYESFTESSPHGSHLCLVLDVAGPSLEDLRLTSPTTSLPIHVVQRAVACVVEELEKLHNCGLIHGAITAGNIVFEIDASRESLDSDLSKLPPCTIERMVTVNGVQYPIVHSHWVPNGIEWNDSRAVVNRCLFTLINLGHAQKMKVDTTWEKSRVDKSLRPSEIILGLPYSSKVDTWMLGHAVYYMLTGKPLVPEDKVADDGLMLAWIIAMSGGSITHDTVLQSNRKDEYFDENGVFKLEVPKETLETRISSSGVVDANEIPGIAKFIQSCLTLDPSRRPSPDDLFRDEWVQPGFEG